MQHWQRWVYLQPGVHWLRHLVSPYAYQWNDAFQFTPSVSSKRLWYGCMPRSCDMHHWQGWVYLQPWLHRLGYQLPPYADASVIHYYLTQNHQLWLNAKPQSTSYARASQLNCCADRAFAVTRSECVAKRGKTIYWTDTTVELCSPIARSEGIVFVY